MRISTFRLGDKAHGPRREPRLFRGGLALALLGVGLAGCARGSKPPSIVLIVIDTLRADHVGALGAGPGRTPNLDQLAHDGVLFERCITQYPMTLPSIVTMFTSQWPLVHRVRGNYDQSLSAAARTLAEFLKDAGYHTAAFVSALPVRTETGLAQGFDVYDDDFSDPFPFYNPKFAALGEYWTGSERRGNVTVDRALAWLKREKKPYFLFVHLFDPHSPYDAPEPHASTQPTPYAGEVAYADALTGRLLAALRDSPDGETPLVAIVSDHGEGLGEHQEWAHGMFLYDTTLHVPWILWWPGRLEARRVSGMVTLLDLAPTIVDALGMATPSEWAGHSRLKANNGEAGRGASAGATAVAAEGKSAGEEDSAAGVYAENYFTRLEYGWSELKAWITSEWKYVKAPRPELYDRKADPNELADLSRARPDVMAQLDSSMTAFEKAALRRAAANRIGELVESITPEERVHEWLAGLGYVGGSRGADLRGPLPDPKDEVPEWNRRKEARRHVESGNRYLADENLLLALTAFRAAVAVKSTGDGLKGLGLTLLRLGQVAEARDTLRAALAQLPDDVAALGGYAIALDGTGASLAADSVLRRATEIDSTHAFSWQQRAILNERLGRLGVAVDCYERYGRLAPDDAAATEALAGIYARLGRHADAAALYRRLAELRPWDPVLLWQLGQAELGSGNPEAARKVLQRARDQIGSAGGVRDSIDAMLRGIAD